MFQRSIALFCLVVVAFSLAGCVVPSPAVMPSATPDVAPTPALGAAFAVAYGQTTTLDAIGMKITFREVVRDSRCPADVNCAWSGIVDVRIEAVMPPQPAQQLLLGGATTVQGVVLGPVVGASGLDTVWYAGYTITLKQVTPYPAHANRPDSPAAYTITLVVELASAGGITPTPPVQPTPTFPADAAGLPLFCVSERVLAERMAGVTSASPVRLTPPVAAAALTDKATATALCRSQFGDDFHAVDVLDSLATWKEFLPAGAAFWRWDQRDGRPVAAPP